jgi:hypothetical protein
MTYTLIRADGTEERVSADTVGVELSTQTVQSFEPAVAQEVEVNRAGEVSTITTDCGRTETTREGDLNFEVTINGIITDEQLSDYAFIIAGGETVDLTCDVRPANGLYVVREGNIAQTNERAYLIDSSQTDLQTEAARQLAFGFEIQLRDPNAPEQNT